LLDELQFSLILLHFDPQLMVFISQLLDFHVLRIKHTRVFSTTRGGHKVILGGIEDIESQVFNHVIVLLNVVMRDHLGLKVLQLILELHKHGLKIEARGLDVHCNLVPALIRLLSES
jgi:hypothetical protein